MLIIKVEFDEGAKQCSMKVHYNVPSYFNFFRKDFFSFSLIFLLSHFRSNNFLALL